MSVSIQFNFIYSNKIISVISRHFTDRVGLDHTMTNKDQTGLTQGRGAHRAQRHSVLDEACAWAAFTQDLAN